MKHDGPSSVGDDIPAHDAFAAMLGIETKLGQLSEQLNRIASRDRTGRPLRHVEHSDRLATDRSFASIRASVEPSERLATENTGQFGNRRDALGEKYANGVGGFLRNTEAGLGERLLATAVQKNPDRIELSGGKSEDTLKAERKSPIDPALGPTASTEDRHRPLAPTLTRLENHVADLANRLAGHEAAQEDLRKLVQSGLGRLDQRIDATKLASETAAQRTQNEASRQAQEELRKLAQREFDRLGQRMDMLKQLAEAAAQRAQNQAVRAAQEELRKLAQTEFGRLGESMDALKRAAESAAERAQSQAIEQARKDLKDLEDRMQTLVTKSQPGAPAPESGQMARLRDEMESLGQRVDDLAVKSASERDLGSLRDAIEQLTARVAQGQDLKPLAELDRRVTEITDKLEQNGSTTAGSRIDAADIDRRIAAALRQNQISPPWLVIERKLAGFSDRLVNTEMQVEHIATLEKWIIQLYRNLEETLDWTRNVAEDAADRMASRLMEEWPTETCRAAASAEFKALENALAAMTTDHKDADERNQKALGTVNEALEQIVGKLSELEQIAGKLTELEQLRDQLQDAASDSGLGKSAPNESSLDPVNWPEEMPARTLLATAAYANQIPVHSLAGPAEYKRRSDGARHDAGLRLSLHVRKRETLATAAHAPAVREATPIGMHRWLIGLVVLAVASGLVTLSALERMKPLAALAQFATAGSDILAGELPEASNAATVIAETDGLANCSARAAVISRFALPANCRSQMVYPR